MQKQNSSQLYNLNSDAPPEIQAAVQSGAVTPKQAYESGFADLRLNADQAKFASSKMCNASKHEPIIANLDMVLFNSGVSLDALCTSALEVCTQPEIDFLMGYHQHGKGLIYLGNVEHVYKRMEAITAALVRNFVDARLITVHDLVELYSEGYLEAQVVVVPDFFTKLCENKTHDEFLRQKMNAYSFLIKLRQRGIRAIVYAHDLGMFVERHGGQLLTDLIKDQFMPLEV